MKDLLNNIAKKPLIIFLGIFLFSIFLIWIAHSNFDGLDSAQRDNIRKANAYINSAQEAQEAQEAKDVTRKEKYLEKAKNILDNFSDRENAIFNTSLGYYYLITGNLADSYASLKKSLSGNNQNLESKYSLHYFKISALNLALKYVNNNKTDEALKIANELLPIDRRNPELHNLLGVCLIRKNNPDEAIEQFKKTLSLNPSHAQALQNLFSIYIQKYQSANQNGNFEYALSIIKEAMRINANNPELHLIAGELYLKLGDKPNAINNFKKSEEINNNRKARNYLSQLGIKN
jgi:tetratricopeptide (TPR) repeat protein